MADKLKGILLLVIAGWFLGYGHHYLASRMTIEEMSAQMASLEQEMEELKAEMPVAAKVTVKATSYSNDPYSIDVPRWRDGKTATNKVARRGHVAADWRLFPPGTRLYIPGYGEAIVEDRGGAVKGYHLDLFVDSREEALKWGVKEMDVFILEKGWIGKEVPGAGGGKTSSLRKPPEGPST
jgi:3D (Asp-Asp-Asp) domain-containing protein